MLKGIFNLSDRVTKQKLLVQIGAMQGPHKIKICKARNTRSTAANAYYWATVIPAFQEYNADQGEFYSDEEAHERLKLSLLPPRKLINHATGELIGILPAHTHDMKSDEFARYVDSCIKFLAEMSVIVPEPSIESEIKSKSGRFAPKAETVK